MSKTQLKNDFANFEIKRLDSNIDTSLFHSEYCDYDLYIKEQAEIYDKFGITQTYLLIEKNTQCIEAYFSIMPDQIYFKDKEKKYPNCQPGAGAIKIHMLAASDNLVRRYSHIAEYLIENIIYLIVNVNQYLNIHYITLDADVPDDPFSYSANPHIQDVYENIGFVKNDDNGLVVSMFLNIYKYDF